MKNTENAFCKNQKQRIFCAWFVMLILLLAASCTLLTSCTDQNKKISTTMPVPQAQSTFTPSLPTPVLLLHSGWTVLAAFHGTGSMTFTDQHIALSSLWGALLVCRGTGRATATFTPPEGDVTANCMAGSGGADARFIMNQGTLLSQFEISTGAFTTWRLQIVNCTANEHTCGDDPVTPAPPPSATP